MDWEQLDWTILERLREKFLSGTAAAGPYWESAADLATYDATYGARIGWKWDAVLSELRLRRWRSTGGSAGSGRVTVLDWGCGSGVAGRRVTDFLGAGNVAALQLWDHAPAAVSFAAARARQVFPSLEVQTWQDTGGPVDVLVLSHVLNELPPAAVAHLRHLIGRAGSVLWVEPGTHETSRHLQAWREEWRGEFQVVAPCPHAGPCGLLMPGHERHWCHHFAPPPPGIFADGNWVRFGQRAGIDLRSLPYSFLVLDRAAPAPPAGVARVIGRADVSKVGARVLSCEAATTAELTVPKRSAAALVRQLDRAKGPLLYRWRREADRVTGGEPAFLPPGDTADPRADA